MTRHPQSERFHALLREIGELHDKKQQDYGRAGAPFANCQASVEWGTPGWVGTMIRANDKMRRLQKYATSGTLTNEGARDSFLDLAVYALIALCLWEDEHLDAEPAAFLRSVVGMPGFGIVKTENVPAA